TRRWTGPARWSSPSRQPSPGRTSVPPGSRGRSGPPRPRFAPGTPRTSRNSCRYLLLCHPGRRPIGAEAFAAKAFDEGGVGLGPPRGFGFGLRRVPRADRARVGVTLAGGVDGFVQVGRLRVDADRCFLLLLPDRMSWGGWGGSLCLLPLTRCRTYCKTYCS